MSLNLPNIRISDTISALNHYKTDKAVLIYGLLFLFHFLICLYKTVDTIFISDKIYHKS